jgi:hypothetical protein
MRLDRLAAAAVLLGALSASASAANSSNYVHATNGIDYFFNTGGAPPTLASPFTTPGGTAPFGFFDCYNKEMLYSPTLVVNGSDPLAGQYAAKVSGIEINFTAATGANIFFPLVVLSSGNGTCTFVTSAGLNWGLATGFGNGFLAVVGPTSGSALTILAAVTNIALANPNQGNGAIYTLAIDVLGTFGTSAITVQEGHDLTLFIHANPNQTAALPNGWTWSSDEKNLCSSHSYMVNTIAGSGTFVFAFFSPTEWGMGVKTIDGVLNAYTTSLGAGASGLNANAAFGIDNGSGAQTLSITGNYPALGVLLGSEVLGFLTYDSDHPAGGSGRYVLGNVVGFRSCFNTSLALPTGGPGGPVFSNAIPQKPRLAGKFDALSAALANLGPTWVAITGHDTAVGAVNVPWFPAASLGASGATGVTGGFAVSVPPFPTLPGIELLWYSAPLNAPVATATFLDPLVNNGHSNTGSYPVQFHP